MSLHDGMHGDHIHHHEEHQDHLQHTTPSPDHHTPFSADMNIQYHDHHTTSHAMDMMKMYFHGGYNEVILFDFWRISSIGGLIGSMIGCFLLGILYEGLKFFREFLISYELRKSSYTHVSPTPVDVNDDTTVTSNNGNNSDSIHTTEQAVSSSTPSPARRNNQVKIIQTSLLSRGHLIQTLLQFIQVISNFGIGIMCSCVALES